MKRDMRSRSWSNPKLMLGRVSAIEAVGAVWGRREMVERFGSKSVLILMVFLATGEVDS